MATNIKSNIRESPADYEEKIFTDSLNGNADTHIQTGSTTNTDEHQKEKPTPTDMSVKGVEDSDTEKGPANLPDQTTRSITGWKWIAFNFSVLSCAFLFALDNTIVANIQPVIIQDFNSISKIAWMSSALLMTAASTNLIWGKIYAQMEAKWTYILCVSMFEVGSTICGAAQNMDTMIIGRAVCGLGGSGMYVGALTLIAANTTTKERPFYIALTGLAWGIGTVLGPIIGGAFCVSAGGWRWSFYINLVIGLVCAPIYVFIIPQWDPRPGVEFSKRAKELDYVGAILTIGAFLSGVTPILLGGIEYAWSSPEIISMFVCSGVLFIVLGVQQVYNIFTSKENRVFPVDFVKSRTMLTLFGCSATGGGVLFLTIYMIPIFFQFTRGDTALESGVRLLPYIVMVIVAIVLNGGVLTFYGLYMPWFTVGSIFTIIGSALMYTVKSTSSVATVYGYSVIQGWGLGLFVQSGFSIAQALVESNDISLAIGFITCAQLSGITIILASANSIFLNQAKTSLTALLPGLPSEQINSAIQGAGSSFVRSLDKELQTKVLSAVVRANSDTYLLAIIGGSISLILSLLMKREKLFMAAAF